MNPYAVYRQEQVNGASPPELVLLLLNEARRRARSAAEALRAGSEDRMRSDLDRVHRILHTLWSSLDHDAGGIAAHLGAFYQQVQEQLFAAEASGDAELLEGAAAALDRLAETWREAMALVQGGADR